MALKPYLFLLFGLLLLPFSISYAQQCGPSGPRAPLASQGLASDIEQLLKKLAPENKLSDPSDQKNPNEIVQVDNSRLIVPGDRVGTYRLGTTELNLSQQVEMAPGSIKLNRDYEKILLLGYVPKRWLRKGKKASLSFAFDTQKKVLREVFIRDKEYQTREGWHVGQRLSELKLDENVDRKRGKKDEEFLRLKGLTIIVRSGIIEAFVLTSKF